jgi:hypothetical protein
MGRGSNKRVMLSEPGGLGVRRGKESERGGGVGGEWEKGLWWHCGEGGGRELFEASLLVYFV